MRERVDLQSSCAEEGFTAHFANVLSIMCVHMLVQFDVILECFVTDRALACPRAMLIRHNAVPQIVVKQFSMRVLQMIYKIVQVFRFTFTKFTINICDINFYFIIFLYKDTDRSYVCGFVFGFNVNFESVKCVELGVAIEAEIALPVPFEGNHRGVL